MSATDRNIRRQVAMKVLHEGSAADEETRLRFVNEAQITGQLEHPGIVPVYDLGTDAEGKVFYTMKLIQGGYSGAHCRAGEDRRRELLACALAGDFSAGL